MHPPRDIADGLAEMKAARIGNKNPNSLVLGCDQVLEFEKQILSKPISKADAKDTTMAKMSGKRHSLLSVLLLFITNYNLFGVMSDRCDCIHANVVRCIYRTVCGTKLV